RLLTAPEWKESFVTIPRGTAMFEINSDELKPADFFEMSDAVEALNEHPNRQWLDQPDKVQTTNFNTSLFLIDLDMRHQREHGSNATITVLYEGGVSAEEGQLHIPAAVLVHEALSQEQLQQLRDVLPPEVPIIDAKTNELLDEVGREEREEGRSAFRLYRRFGEFAVGDRKWDDDSHRFSSMYNDIFTHASREYTNQDAYYTPVDFEWLPFDDHSEGYGSGDNYYYDDYKTGSRQGETHSQATEPEEPSGPMPESDEVRAYRERTEQAARERAEEQSRKANENYKIVDDAAQEKFGRPLEELSDKEKTSLRREASKKYHPDVATEEADSERFSAFEQLLK
ncbi:MAG TPA: hypothetical protein VFT59_02410, partial [Candidatus Saccharimonadales bacterium]|nr:hypothetical protein [Candidatus Saccharimonadales bacterium]